MRSDAFMHYIQSTVQHTVQDVLLDGTRKEDRLLLNEADLAAPPLHIEVLDVDPIDENLAGLGVVKALQKRHHSRFTTTTHAIEINHRNKNI